MIKDRYSEITDWLFRQLPMYQRTGGANYKIDLEKTHQLMEVLGHPEKDLTCIHVAGTNGKGSVSHMLASIFQEAGYRTGLYTSPHLVDFRERIRVNGITISEDEVVDFVDRYKEDFERLSLSFFEMTVGMAFWHFRAMGTEMAIIEVGMGGRLDSTNVVTPEISVITNIGLDHTAFLGPDRPSIAKEKAGIIKNGIPVVIGERDDETRGVFESIARNLNSKLSFSDEFEVPELVSDLKGGYQRLNIRTVWATLQNLKEWTIPMKSILSGLGKVRTNTGLRGRWDLLWDAGPTVIADTGHNSEGLMEVVDHLKKVPHNRLLFVIGMVNDKDRSSVLDLLPREARYFVTQPSIPRACPVEELHREIREKELSANMFSTVKEAVIQAIVEAGHDDLIFVGGSTFVVADLLAVEDEVISLLSSKGPIGS
ncbi:MAG: bifunctional folylpolyglutamate synthase/dihydrofolate synthase [Bacteroidota bacterium]|nr:bifunctional folylpolyglutamate synthase/dihydrofolate synthase [Bacteroidota bacterium]